MQLPTNNPIVASAETKERLWSLVISWLTKAQEVELVATTAPDLTFAGYTL